MKGKANKKVYKTNTKLLKKILLITLVIFIVMCLYTPIKSGLTYLYLNSWSTYEIKDYDFNIKLPRAYKELEDVTEKTGLNIFSVKTEENIQINEEYAIEKPEVVYSGANVLNGVSLKIQCLQTSKKTTKTLDEIAEGNYILVRLFYEDDYKLGQLNKEYTKILGNDAVKAMIDISNEDETNTFVTYLMPSEDKEITITFLGKKENILNSMDEIEKIINKIN